MREIEYQHKLIYLPYYLCANGGKLLFFKAFGSFPHTPPVNVFGLRAPRLVPGLQDACYGMSMTSRRQWHTDLFLGGVA